MDFSSRFVKMGFSKIILMVAFLSFSYCFETPPILLESLKMTIRGFGEKCAKTVNATTKDLEPLRGGPPYTGKAACVLACIFEKLRVMDGKSFSKSGFMKTVSPFMLGDPKKISHMTQIAGSCEKEIKSAPENECEVANHLIICLRKNIPQISELKMC